jgi:8-oxo-dGTP pyrophosphatase MutT (NUDIX family)
MRLEMDENKLHCIAVTGIIRNNHGKYLICKRNENEKAFPGKWCVPGGKLEKTDFVNKPKDTSDHWLDVFERVLEREILEETKIKIKNIGYVSNLAFIRPNGFSTIIISLYAEHDFGDVVLDKNALIDYAWITLEEAKNYDLIENIYEQIEKVDNLFKRGNDNNGIST